MNNKQDLWNNLSPGYYDKIIFSNHHVNRGPRASWHNIVYKNIKIKKSVNHLDYACGSGTFIGNYSDAFSIGYDISKEQVSYSNKNYGSSFKKFTSSIEIIESNKPYHIITVLGLIEFMEDSEILKLIEYLKSLLSEDGKIVLTTPNYNFFLKRVIKYGQFLGLVDYDSITKNQFDYKSIQSLIEKTDFEYRKTSKILTLSFILGFFSPKLSLYFDNLLQKFLNEKMGFILKVELNQNK